MFLSIVSYGIHISWARQTFLVNLFKISCEISQDKQEKNLMDKQNEEKIETQRRFKLLYISIGMY